MNIGIYDPYFHILGGAERYVLTIAKCLKNNTNIIFYAKNEDLQKVPQKFGMDVSYITARNWPANRPERNQELSKLDLFFYVTDGSIFRSPAKKNILIIQSPLHIPKRSLLNSVKLFSWQKLICYSNYMATIIQQRLAQKATILFVPIDQVEPSTTKKENIIISVGRFFPHLHNKKQRDMVTTFRELIKNVAIQSELYLVGSVDPGGEAYLAEVQKTAAGFPVKILTDVSFSELQQLYARAKVYWHAAGFGEDLVRFPEKAEHFGVVTLEAMAHAAVPVVFAGGGQLEIVDNGYNGFIWRNTEELIKYTKELLTNDIIRNRLMQNCITTAEKYSIDHFCSTLHEILES